MDLNREELAWAAGFFDGEGSFCLQRYLAGEHRSDYVSVFCSVHQNERPSLDRFRAAVGNVGKVYGPYPKKNGNPYHKFQTGKFEHMQAIVAMLWHHLSEPKRQAARNVLAAVYR